MKDTTEHRRLRMTHVAGALWKYWGPYLSERQWGTVREDYSPNGDAWQDGAHRRGHGRW